MAVRKYYYSYPCEALNMSIVFLFYKLAYGLGAPIATSLIGGGPATMIWGYVSSSYLNICPNYGLARWVLVCVLSQPIALSLAEICSQYPTSAGAYYWCFRLASPRSRVLLSWINGWLTMVGVWTVSLSVTFGNFFLCRTQFNSTDMNVIFSRDGAACGCGRSNLPT